MIPAHYPPIDLRHHTDVRYSQYNSRRCGSYALRAAIRIMCRRAGVPRVPSADYIWHWGKVFAGHPNGAGDVGATVWHYASALAAKGFCWAEDFSDGGDVNAIPTVEVNALAALNKPVVFSTIPYLNDDICLSIYRRLQWGQPVVINFRRTSSYGALTGSLRYHVFDGSYETGGFYTEHLVTIVGALPAEGRFIIEDSAGTDFGDDGYTGFTFDKFLPGPQACVTHIWYLEQLPVPPKKVESFMPVPATLTPAELAPFMEQMRAQWGTPLFEALGPNGNNYQGMIDRAVQLDYSDRMIEFAARWTRGFIVNFVASNPGSLDISRLRKEPLL